MLGWVTLRALRNLCIAYSDIGRYIYCTQNRDLKHGLERQKPTPSAGTTQNSFGQCTKKNM